MKNVITILLTCFWVALAGAQEFANVEYLCADWGPAMRLPSKECEKPNYSDTEEEIYFLKQVGRFTRKTHLVPGILSGSNTEDIGHGISIYLCKMKPDGSAKTEIKELWKNPNYPIDTQSQSTWMAINDKTRKIALAITLAGSDVTGLWTMKLDGSDLQHTINPTLIEGHLQSIHFPSWTPDGKCIVFGESLRGAMHGRITKCDMGGKNLVYLTDGPADSQPRVSPAGTKVVYRHDPMIKLGQDGRGERRVAATLWLMSIDGSDKQEIPNPEAKPDWPTKGRWGTFPTWSPDGKKLLLTDGGLVDVENGKMLWRGAPFRDGKQHSWGWAHWGKLGIVGYNLSGILFTDNDIRESKTLGSSQLVECKGGPSLCAW